MGYSVDGETRSMGVCYGLLRIVMMATGNCEEREHPGDRWVVAYLSFLSRWLYPRLREQWNSNLKVRKGRRGETVALKSSSVSQRSRA